MRKSVKWNWGKPQQQAFDQIKTDIATITTLKHYDPSAQTILTTDASRKGLGATLWQTDEEGKQPVAFASRYLNSAEQNYATNELELLAVKWATEHFKQYLPSVADSRSKQITRPSYQSSTVTELTRSTVPGLQGGK